MPVTTIRSEDQYHEAVTTPGLSAVSFVAPWDESSKAISPKWKQFSDNPRWRDMSFFRVDICDQQDVAMDAAVQMAPTFRFFRDGTQVDEYVGSSYPALERKMGSVVRSASDSPSA